MSKKASNQSGKMMAKVNANRSGRLYPVEEEELELQQARLRRAAAASVTLW